MYCSTCGVAVAQGLRHCKNCGAKLYQNEDVEVSAEREALLVRAMVLTFVFGLMLITIFMGVMKAVLDLQVGQILGILIVPFLMMFILEGVFIKQLLFSHKKSAAELNPAQTQALPEATPMPSVTEHTTRAFEPVYQDRKQT